MVLFGFVEMGVAGDEELLGVEEVEEGGEEEEGGGVGCGNIWYQQEYYW